MNTRSVEFGSFDQSENKDWVIDNLKAELAAKDERIKSLEQRAIQLEKLAYTDPLTGLWNRNGLKKLLEEERVGRENEKDKPMSILVLDVDHFKSINDKFGHHVGDRVLEILGQELVKSVRSTDIVARWGGEELVVVFPGIDEDAVLARFAPKVDTEIDSEGNKHSTFNRTINLDGQTLEITMSGGVTNYNPSTESYQDALNRADFALYEAKGDHIPEGGGRNRILGAKKIVSEKIKSVGA